MRKVFILSILAMLILVPSIVYAGHRTDHPAELADSINTPDGNYTVYYTNDDATDSDYFTTAQAQLLVNAIDTTNGGSPAFPGQHDLFVNLGFDAPFFNPSGPNEVYIYNSSNLGGAYFAGIDIDAPSYLGSPELDIRLVIGHELFHHVQYGYIDNGSISGCGGTWSKWTCEGSARMMQDKLYTDLDLDPGTTQASYLGEITTYLQNTNRTLTSLSYKAVLFWNYMTERLGTAAEPQYGVDVIEQYWANAESSVGGASEGDSVQILRDTIQDFDVSLSLEELFQDFAITNYSKDLDVTALVDALDYRYIDDNATAYSQLSAVAGNDSGGNPTFRQNNVPAGGNLGPTNDSVSSFAAKYAIGNLPADPNDCQILSFNSTGDSLAYALMAITGANDVERLYKSTTTNFAKALINRPAPDNYTQLAAVFAGMGSSATYDHTFSCGDATLEIVRPTSVYEAKVGLPADPDRFLVIVNALSSAVGTPSIEGLDISDFEAIVGGDTATILSGAYVQGSYWLVVQAPVKGAAGVYDLTVNLGALATDTNANSVDYTKELKDQVLVIDKSGSMNSPAGNTKIDAAKNAARLFVDAAADDDQLGVVSFSGDLVEPNDDADANHLLQVVLGQRTTAKNLISAIALENMTSIGDGINKGQDEIDVRGIPEAVDNMVLLSDGMENEDDYWADIEATIVGKGTVIYAIALGPTTDQAKMQAIATATGGDYLYVDLSGASVVSGSTPSMLGSLPLANDLANTYRLVNETIMNQERLWENAGTIGESQQVTLPIPVNEGGLTHAVLTVNWVVPDFQDPVQITLFRPDGSTVNSGPDVQIIKDSTHVAYHMEKLDPLGNWTLLIAAPKGRNLDYVASLSARTRGAQMELFLGQNSSPESKFMVGVPMPIIAILTDKKGPIQGADVEAVVQHPDGKTDRLRLFDDGNHGDGEPDDGVYVGNYTRTTQGSTEGVDDRDRKDEGQRGSYGARAWASGKSNEGEQFERHKGTSFQLFQIPDEPTIDARLDLDKRTEGRLVHLFFRIGNLVLKVDADTVDPKDFEVNGQTPVQAMVDEKERKEIWLTMPEPVNTQIPLDVRWVGPINMERFTLNDADEDRLPDRWEALYPCVILGKDDAGADPDKDGLNNFQELQNGTNPCDADTDDGGESDGSEVNRGADPLNPRDDGVPTLVGVGVFVADTDDSPRIKLRPNSNMVQYPPSRYQQLALYRSLDPNGQFEQVAVIDPAKSETPGVHIDNGVFLKPDVPYYYMMMGMGPKGETTAFSRVFMGIPRTEPYAPRGSVLINGGAHCTTNAGTPVTLSLNVLKQLLNGKGDAAGPAMFTTEGLEMIISNSPNFEKATWQPYKPVVEGWQIEPDKATDIARVYVKYRDANGLESIVENDGIRVKKEGTLGAIVGQVLLEGQDDHTGTPIMVIPTDPRLHVAQTDEAGDFDYGPLMPGAYNLMLSRDGYVTQTLKDVRVMADQITNIGKITLLRDVPARCKLDLVLSHDGANIKLDFTLGMTVAPTSWNVWMAAQNSIFPLWQIPNIPVTIEPPINIPVQFPLSGLGKVGVLTTLTTQDAGLICWDFEVVDTGSPRGSTNLSIPQLRERLQGVRPNVLSR